MSDAKHLAFFLFISIQHSTANKKLLQKNTKANIN